MELKRRLEAILTPEQVAEAGWLLEGLDHLDEKVKNKKPEKEEEKEESKSSMTNSNTTDSSPDAGTGTESESGSGTGSESETAEAIPWADTLGDMYPYSYLLGLETTYPCPSDLKIFVF
jgi:hypothetical protein